MASLGIKNIRKTYPNGVEVLKGIDLDIEDGEFLILVGGSGCGKSTLLNMIAGLETVTEGEIAIGGKRVNDLPPKDRDIAMVFQSYALYPSMSVRENIAFGLSLRKVPKAEQDATIARVAKLLEYMGDAESLVSRLCRRGKAIGRFVRVRRPGETAGSWRNHGASFRVRTERSPELAATIRFTLV